MISKRIDQLEDDVLLLKEAIQKCTKADLIVTEKIHTLNQISHSLLDLQQNQQRMNEILLKRIDELRRRIELDNESV